MEIAQNHVGLPYNRLITAVKTCFAYLIDYFRSLIESKGSINYLYGLMENITDIISEKNSLTYWSVTSTVVTAMRHIVGSIVKNQAYGGKWLISEAIVDTVRIYIYFCGY